MPQSVIERAFDYILANEGGRSNHAKDKGGATNLGVTLKQFRIAAAQMDGHVFDLDGDGDIDADDLNLMLPGLAMDIFTRYYWQSGFHYLEPRVAIKTADYGFNMGPTSGVKRLQNAVNMMAKKLNSPGLVVDGQLGPKSIQLANLCRERDLLECLQLAGQNFYTAIVAKDPEQACFLKGWINRAMRLPQPLS